MDILRPIRRVAVRMKDYIVIISSKRGRSGHVHRIWTYSLWTEEWRECPIKTGLQLPPTDRLCGVAIGSVIYMFGGQGSTDLWKLTQARDGSFSWNKVTIESQKMPSPRCGHCGWEYADKMWIFGGYGESPIGYLNDYGDFVAMGPDRINNQLCSYDPTKQTWKNTECSGKVPSPREYASAAIIKNKVWLYGGYTTLGWEDELYELNVYSLEWTHIHVDTPRPGRFGTSSLTPLTYNKLLLHGDLHKAHSTWILDVESYRWRQYQEEAKCDCVPSYTGIPGLNNDAIIVVGGHVENDCDTDFFSVTLEPKSLQQLAITIIYEHKASLPWTSLPSSLRCKLMGTVCE